MTTRRRITLGCFCLTLFAFIFLQRPTTTAAQGTVWIYCASDTGQNIVYFSPVFDSKLPLHTTIDTLPIGNEFTEYLIGRFDYKRGAGCPGGYRQGMEDSRRTLESQARQANKQVVEVEWTYTPNPVEISRHQVTGHEANVQGTGLPRTHTFCLSDSDHGTFYATGPIEAGGDMTYAQWNTGFNRFLAAKFSFKGNARCSVVTLDNARRLMKARTEGALAAGRKVVDTGWKYDPAAVVVKQAPKDDDPEPTPKRPAPPSSSQQTRDAAVKELPDSKAYCEKDPLMSAVYNCEWFARNVSNYRNEHPGDNTPIVSLVSEAKMELASAIDSVRVSLWVSKRGNAQHLDNKVINCVTQSVIVTLYKTPQANQLLTFYKN
ncbi:MAG TPA: hypothetical protein VJS64_01075, partial [Pyrinomonadaceae bacterium]|nr:hypothetical protein [Pyrinomonadaceae bacterium]